MSDNELAWLEFKLWLSIIGFECAVFVFGLVIWVVVHFIVKWW